MASTAQTVEIVLPLEHGKARQGQRAVECQRHNLGSTNGPRQSKLDTDFHYFPPRVTAHCRDAFYVAFAQVCGPSDIINTAINDVIDCLEAATVAAGLASIIAGPVAATPSFATTFKGCLAAKIGGHLDEITVNLYVEVQTGNWGPC